jgi:hypothetical protein
MTGRITHGLTRIDGRRNPLFSVWADMHKRCENPNATNYAYYGGRGIAVCARWCGERGFEHFLADMGERPEGLTLDRRDAEGNYEPSNCRWATHAEQTANRRPYEPVRHLGEDNPRARLTEGQVREVRLLAAKGRSQQLLAREMGVSEATISLIVNRKTWRHI